jgi:hypothetical protein
MKTSYEAYKIGSKVYGVSRWQSEGKETDHLAVYEAIVENICISYDRKTDQLETYYGLKTPDGESWGEDVSSKEVSDNFDELIGSIRQEWVRNSNRQHD